MNGCGGPKKNDKEKGWFLRVLQVWPHLPAGGLRHPRMPLPTAASRKSFIIHRVTGGSPREGKWPEGRLGVLPNPTWESPSFHDYRFVACGRCQEVQASTSCGYLVRHIHESPASSRQKSGRHLCRWRQLVRTTGVLLIWMCPFFYIGGVKMCDLQKRL